MAKRYERRKAAAQALGIELDKKPMHELREMLEADEGATERYNEILGDVTPTPDPEPEPDARPASTPAKRSSKAKSNGARLTDPGDALKAALASANTELAA